MTDISIVTPTYNRAGLLPRAWQSIRSQDIDWRWIVVDDGSTDDTPNVVAGFDDSRISYIRLPINRGVNAARNAGAQAAGGRYVVFLDSDDELYPGALTGMVRAMDTADESVGACAFACTMAVTGKKISRLVQGEVLDEQSVVCLAGLQQGGDSILVYRREVLDHFQLPEDLRGCEQVFVYQLSTRYRYLMVDQPGSIVHRQGDNLSGAESQISRSRDIAVSYERILDNHRDILRLHDDARRRFLRKAMYRYGVAGRRRDVCRVYCKLAKERTGLLERLSSDALFLLSVTVPRAFERWRINRSQRELTELRAS